MPRELHDRLARQADKQGLTGERRNAYIYGTMQKTTNWRPHKDNARRIRSMKNG
jgi:hypothetical protein